MKIIKAFLAGIMLLFLLYLILFKPVLFMCISFGILAYAGFSDWIFRSLKGKVILVLKSLLFLTIMFIFIGGFYFQLKFAAMFTGWLLALIMVLFPVVLLWLAYMEKRIGN